MTNFNFDYSTGLVNLEYLCSYSSIVLDKMSTNDGCKISWVEVSGLS